MPARRLATDSGLIALVAALAAALLAVGCGGSGSDDKTKQGSAGVK